MSEQLERVLSALRAVRPRRLVRSGQLAAKASPTVVGIALIMIVAIGQRRASRTSATQRWCTGAARFWSLVARTWRRTYVGGFARRLVVACVIGSMAVMAAAVMIPGTSVPSASNARKLGRAEAMRGPSVPVPGTGGPGTGGPAPKDPVPAPPRAPSPALPRTTQPPKQPTSPPPASGNDTSAGTGSGASPGGGATPQAPAPAPAPASHDPMGTWIAKAVETLKTAGYSADQMNPTDIQTIIVHESGGNPGAMNDWDSNAVAGTPSKGLMQCIDSTFRAWALPGHSDIWNPVDSIIAGVRYAIGRYGSVSNVPGVVGVKNGTGYVGY